LEFLGAASIINGMSEQPLQLQARLASFAITRTVMNTGYRMVYPFLPALARGLGVDLDSIALVVTIRSTMGFFTPIYGSAADQWGRRITMLVALALYAAGMIGVAVFPTYPVFLVGMVLGGASKAVFDAAMQAHLGDTVPYERRGFAVAMVEVGWSAAFLLGMPVMGVLIDKWGWTAPFPWLAALTLLMAYVLYRQVPPDRQHKSERISFVDGARTVLTHPVALFGLIASAASVGANEIVSIVYGAWMEESFTLNLTALGAASAVIGIAELGGEGLVATLSDRLGKKRAIMLGLGLNAVTCLAMPLISHELIGAMIGLFFYYLTFEFSLVSIIPMMTELVPGARATMMAANVAAFQAARALGALAGPRLFDYGLIAVVGTAAVLNVIAVVILLLLVKAD
jgi:predicted MFS family arabinose efflux permease